MLISTRGRYALRVIIDLAEHQNAGFVPLKEIAERQAISEKYLESVLKVLVREHVLTGLRGKGGGYQLAQSPEEITVGSIIRLTEGDLAPVACLQANAEDCPRRGECRTLPMWQQLNTLVNDYLDSVTLAELMKQCENQPLDII